MDESEIVRAIFQGALGRALDKTQLEHWAKALRNGHPLSDMVARVVSSEEFKGRQQPKLEASPLPDLTAIYSTRYSYLPPNDTIFHARDNEGIELMEALIDRHRYYEHQNVWHPVVDLDKRVTASIIQGMGARSCVELGCFSGSVLGVLQEHGVDVCGVELSHRAFLLAPDNIYTKMRFGHFADLVFDRQFDAFLGMDVLEHLSPLKLDRCILKIATILSPDGFAYINSPMFGRDAIYGQVSNQYLTSWSAAGDSHFWYDLHCDSKGWPMHGHLVWASPVWWEASFARHGLVRDTVVEKLVHGLLADFFEHVAPARRSLFVLRHGGAERPDYHGIESDLRAALSSVLADDHS